jgi:PAS domain S-box-containing protein
MPKLLARWPSLLRHPEPLSSLAARYGSAFGIAAAAVALRIVLEPQLEHAGFAIFLGAVLLGAWVGGLGPSLISQTALLFVQARLFLHDVPAPESVITTRGIVSISAYYLVGSLVGLLSEARRSALDKVKRQNERIAHQQEQLRATIAGIGDAVLTVNASRELTFLNPAAESLTGWSQGEAIGLSLDRVAKFEAAEDNGSSTNPLVAALDSVDRVCESQMLPFISRDGRKLPVTFTATPIRTPAGMISGAVIILRDETERQSAEMQLQDMNRRKDDFLATLAHELRNPLAPIRTGLQLMKLSRGDQAVAAEVQSIMERQVQHIIRLVDDLLDVSRISRGKLQLQTCPTNFSRVVANAVETMRSQIQEAGHELVLTLPDDVHQVEGDPDRLTQIACNLLHNAIKFTPQGGRIEVRVEHTQDEARLCVIDNGSGIRPENLESIFEMFNQGMLEKERGKMGLGVGLTLARRLAEMHGGTVDAQSDGVNCGSTFRLRLPLQNRFAMITPTKPQEFPGRNAMRRRVLLVDDNEDGLRMMEMMIRSLGHEIATAANGQEAVKKAESFAPEVIFMDLGMPVMNGYEAVRRIREASWGREMLIVATTGWGQENDRRRTMEAGFDDHLVKPVEMEALRSCLERKRLTTEALKAS